MTKKPKILLRPLLFASLSCAGAFGQTCGQCLPTWTVQTPTLINQCSQPTSDLLTKSQPYLVSWPDGVSAIKTNAAPGECMGNEECNYQDTVNCWAYFNTPVASAGLWYEDANDGVAEFVSGHHQCPNNNHTPGNLACTFGTQHRLQWARSCQCSCTGSPTFVCSNPGGIGYVSPTCVNGQFACTNGAFQCSIPPPTGGCTTGYVLTCSQSGWMCNCQGGCGNCPVLDDTQSQGFHLTDWEHGVRFAFYPDSAPIQLSWTDPAYANGWLAMDRNGNGLIDDGTELFGNITPQPPSDAPNGFLALAVFDQPENGGNGNGVIDPRDAVFPYLRVWVDANHDGISQPDELKTLQELGIFRIDLNYRSTPFRDRYGNQFRYKGTLWDGGDRQATYDVFLTAKPVQP